MKKILALIILGLPLSGLSAGLPYDFSKVTKFDTVNVNRITVGFHSSLPRDKRASTLKYITRILNEINKTIPDTVENFRNQHGKVLLFELKGKGGMEFVRSGQSSWDGRINPALHNSIIIAKAHTYSRSGHIGFAYMLHEMTHFHHLQVMGHDFDDKIKVCYNAALTNPLYKGVYASSNYLEYFAEISTAYLVKSHRTSRFPKGSKELFIHDKLGYELCKNIWGATKAAYKPTPQTINLHPGVNPAWASEPKPEEVRGSGGLLGPYVAAQRRAATVVPHNPSCRCTRCSRNHATEVFRSPTDSELLMSKKFLEVIYTMNRADSEFYSGNEAYAGWLYSNSLSMLEGFKADYPNDRVGVVNSLIKKLKNKIN
jgi:hypothetical protein